MRLTRRHLLALAAATAATSASANAPLTSPRPIARNITKDSAARLIAQAGLSGQVGFVLADMSDGAIIEDINADLPLPPASVTKAVTAQYALTHLGGAHRFATRVLAQGPVIDGVLEGNLILAGGGDPNLLTDDMAALVDRLHATGLREVRGAFQVWDDALVNLDEIDPGQLDHAGYNPTITGLNLNFNRVHFEWKRQNGRYTTTMDARSELHRPIVTTSRIQIVERDSPLFTYRQNGDVDDWTVAKGALNNAGSRWLPVRNPALYAGQVFASFARSRGLALSAPTPVSTRPNGQEIARFDSAPLRELMRSMLKYSTNITAEAAGLAATHAATGQQRGLRTSALGMSRWSKDFADLDAYFVDHSGLGDESRMTAGQMVRFLRVSGVADELRPLLRPIAMLDGNRRPIPAFNGLVQAKTGTLNFVSCLAGYLRTGSGRDLAFAFFGADLAARERGKRSGNDVPAGSVNWNRKAKDVQQKILQTLIRWG